MKGDYRCSDGPTATGSRYYPGSIRRSISANLFNSAHSADYSVALAGAAVCASAPGVGNGRPSLKCGQIPPFVADNTTSWAKEEARQNNSLEPSLRRRGPELVSLAYTAMGG